MNGYSQAVGIDGHAIHSHAGDRDQPQRQWWTNIGAEKTFSVGGNTLWRYSTALRLLWMAEHEPEILKRTHKWLSIEDFLNFMLCGKEATDYSMASCTLLFDQKKRAGRREILGLSGIDRRLLSDPRPSGTPLGEVTAAAAKATGLREGTPVVLGGHDYLCGALPVGAFSPAVLLDVSGTWEVVLATIPPAGPHAGAAENRGHGGKPRGPGHVCCHGRGCIRGDARMVPQGVRLRSESKGGRARMRGLGHPHGGGRGISSGQPWGPLPSPLRRLGLSRRGHALPRGICRSQHHNERGDMLRGLIEGLDYQLLDIIRQMESGVGFDAEKLVVVGGAARNPFWMQNKADVTGKGIEVPEVEDTSPLGAAMLARDGVVGIYEDGPGSVRARPT